MTDSSQTDVSTAQERLYSRVTLCGWGVLFLVWVIWAWWAAVIAVMVVLTAYWGAVRAARDYGDLLRSTFDLHRFALYQAAHWPPPASTAAEPAYGERLTEYLFRGVATPPLAFEHTPQK